MPVGTMFILHMYLPVKMKIFEIILILENYKIVRLYFSNIKLIGFSFAQKPSFHPTEVQFLSIFCQNDFVVGSDMKFK